MFEKIKYQNAVGFGLVLAREKLEKNGETYPQSSYDEVVATLFDSEYVTQAVAMTNKLKQQFGSGAAYLAAAYQFAQQYWIYEPFAKAMPDKAQRVRLMYWAMMFAVAQAGIGDGWEEHAQGILGAAKEHVEATLGRSGS
jgi:hypothetical protein